jgi:hypothetical protein
MALMCVHCGGGPERQTGPAPVIVHTVVEEFCRAHSVHWLLVYGFLLDRLKKSGRLLEEVPFKTWMALRDLLHTMRLERDTNDTDPPPYRAQVCDTVVLAGPISADEWTALPLVLDRDFFGTVGEIPGMPAGGERVFFHMGGLRRHGTVLGYPLVSELGHISMTEQQHAFCATRVISLLEARRADAPMTLLAPAILWALLHGDTEEAAAVLLTWTHPGKQLPPRARKRENWILLLEWLELLHTPGRREIDMCWVILRNFLSPITGNLGSRTGGTTALTAELTLIQYRVVVDESERQEIFEIGDPDDWWESVLRYRMDTVPFKNLETMYYFGKMTSVMRGQNTEQLNKVFRPCNGTGTGALPGPDDEPTIKKYEALYTGLCAAEHRRRLLRPPRRATPEVILCPPAWVNDSAVPAYQLREGVVLNTLLPLTSSGTDSILPHSRIVPARSAYCRCPREGEPQNCPQAPYDRREDMIHVVRLLDRMGD